MVLALNVALAVIYPYCHAFTVAYGVVFFFFFLKCLTEDTHNSLGGRLYLQIIGGCAQREGTVFNIATDQRGRRLVETERLSSTDKTVL